MKTTLNLKNMTHAYLRALVDSSQTAEELYNSFYTLTSEGFIAKKTWLAFDKKCCNLEYDEDTNTIYDNTKDSSIGALYTFKECIIDSTGEYWGISNEQSYRDFTGDTKPIKFSYALVENKTDKILPVWDV